MPAITQQTSVLLNWPGEPPPQRTFVIFGSRRGGTSLVAGIVRALGIDLGQVGTRTNNEDPDFQARGAARMRQAIADRNAENDVWGWKFPAAGHYLPDLLPSLRNPHLVVVFRDPVAAALSQLRRDRPISKRTPSLALHESTANLATNMGLVLALEHPCLLISSERAVASEALIDEIADFVSAPRPEGELRARMIEYTTPGQYKSYDEFFATG